MAKGQVLGLWLLTRVLGGGGGVCVWGGDGSWPVGLEAGVLQLSCSVYNHGFLGK
jgi:hypothetical protein